METTENYNIKEFNDSLTARFTYEGETFSIRIPVKDIIRMKTSNKWYYNFRQLILSKGFMVDFRVYGTLDEFGNIRTSGPCLLKKGDVVPAQFFVTVSDGTWIDDVDVIGDDDTSAKEYIGAAIEKIEAAIGSGYIAFASPAPSSTERLIKDKVFSAKALLHQAVRAMESLY